MSYLYAERHESALSVALQAIPALMAQYGPNHSRTAQALIAYAAVLRKLKRNEEERRVEKQAKSIQASSGRTAHGATISLSDLMSAQHGRRAK